MLKNMRSDTRMGSPTLFWGLMLSVSTICIWSTHGESKYLLLLYCVKVTKGFALIENELFVSQFNLL